MLNPHKMKAFNLQIILLILFINWQHCEAKYRKVKNNQVSPVGPPYPVTASFFKDRFTSQEWNITLTQFKKQGGDSVFLRAPPVLNGIPQNGNFKWCDGCMQQAKADMKSLGLNISNVWTFEYEEGFSDAIMLCPSTDKKIISSRIYHRIVLPTNTKGMKSSCDFPKGSNVVILFTSFSGIDPHQILVETAAKQNVSVYLGLPKAPLKYSESLMTAYYAWVNRVLLEHKSRYSALKMKLNKKAKAKSLYDTIAGYFSGDNCDLPRVIIQDKKQPAGLNFTNLYKEVGDLVHNVGKHFVISPSLNTNKHQINGTLENNVRGFEILAKTKAIDIIAVREGRGSGKGGYFWPAEEKTPIHVKDEVLDQMLHTLQPKMHPNVTFSQVFLASNEAIFRALKHSRDNLKQSNISVDLWLNVEAYETLHDDPCLPVDTQNSGNGEMINRATKQRVDQGIGASGAQVQRVMSFAWDSDFTCTTKKLNTSLKDEIQADLNRPILADCFFHSRYNLSVVVLGFNAEGINSFTVNWTDTSNSTRTNSMYGYYFELDYGAENNLVESLQYIMLYDISSMPRDLARKGTIHVTQQNSKNDCYFDYDISYFHIPERL